MGFSFKFFGTQEVRKFNYRPRFYDPEKEARKKMFGDHSVQKKDASQGYVPGQLVKGSIRDGKYSKTEEVGKNQKYIGMITLILLFGVIYLIYEYFPLLVEALSR